MLPFAFACGSSSSGAGGPSGDQACADLAAARCERNKQCSTYSFETRYGDDATCLANEKTYCANSLSVPQTARTPALVEQCATAFGTLSCNDWLSNTTPATCQSQSGALANGAACVFNSQCQSTYCNTPDGFGCGRCSPKPAVGDPCNQTTQHCGDSLFCAAKTGTCATPAQNGQQCDTDSPCVSGLSCVGITPTSHGTCQPAASSVGATCDPKAETAPTCDPTKGLICNSTTKQCEAMQFAAPGQPCGAINGVTVFCVGEGFCTIASGQKQGTCTAASAEGGPCDTVNGPNCQYELRCVATSGTAGTCRMPVAALCP